MALAINQHSILAGRCCRKPPLTAGRRRATRHGGRCLPISRYSMPQRLCTAARAREAGAGSQQASWVLPRIALTTIDSPLATLSPGDLSQLTILPCTTARGNTGEKGGGRPHIQLSPPPRATGSQHKMTAAPTHGDHCAAKCWHKYIYYFGNYKLRTPAPGPAQALALAIGHHRWCSGRGEQRHREMDKLAVQAQPFEPA